MAAAVNENKFLNSRRSPERATRGLPRMGHCGSSPAPCRIRGATPRRIREGLGGETFGCIRSAMPVGDDAFRKGACGGKIKDRGAQAGIRRAEMDAGIFGRALEIGLRARARKVIATLRPACAGDAVPMRKLPARSVSSRYRRRTRRVGLPRTDSSSLTSRA